MNILQLNLNGFDTEAAYKNFGANEETVDFACRVLLANKIPLEIGKVQAALKEIFGSGISNSRCCQLLKDWKRNNLKAIKNVKTGDGILEGLEQTIATHVPENLEIPEEFKLLSERFTRLLYSQAYSVADSSISGDRIAQLTKQLDEANEKLKGYPTLDYERGWYQREYERVNTELKDAYIKLNTQKLAESEDIRNKLNKFDDEKRELLTRNQELEEQVARLATHDQTERELNNQIARLQGTIEGLEKNKTQLEAQIKELKKVEGEKAVVENQVAELRQQLEQANQTVINLQTQQVKGSSILAVDVDTDALLAEKDQEIAQLKQQIQEMQQSQPQPKRNKNQQPVSVS
ncbi:MAG TPA: hypothetical protein VK203_06170 [Nostocaceae cyanobacterium]|nr:hypothetical protein [Nostocaceae cyanobacterium]